MSIGSTLDQVEVSLVRQLESLLHTYNAHLFPVGTYQADFGNTDSLINAGVLIADGDSSIVRILVTEVVSHSIHEKSPAAVLLPAGPIDRYYPHHPTHTGEGT